MKKIVHPSYFVFDPSNNRVDFTNFPNFNFTYLYAIINVTTGQLVYSTAGQSAGLQGTYSNPFVNLVFDVTSMSPTDELQIIYNLPAQPIADADENAIGSTLDLDSGELGLNFNLLNSSFGGRINQPMPTPHEDKALAIGINNGGVLKSPAIDPVSHQLLVDVTQSGPVPVALSGGAQFDLLSYGGGTGVGPSSPLPATPFNPATGLPISFGAGATDNQTQRVTANINQMSDQNWSASSQTALGNNIITGTTSALDVSGFRSFTCAISSTATGGTYIFEQSNDNANFVALPVVNASLISGTIINAAITATATTIIYSGPVMARYIRCRIATALTGGSASSTTKISMMPFVPTVQAVAQATSTNLAVSATIASGTVTTVSTVSAVTSANLASASTTDIASAAITTTQTSANISTLNTQACSWGVFVTATAGTPTMDVQIQETINGVDFYTIYAFERITTTGQYYSPCIKLSGSGYRIIRTIGGSTPSVTNSVIRISRSGQAETMRRFIDRTVDANTLNSTTPSYFCEGVEDFNLIVRCTAQTTPATIALEFSMDNTNWFTSTSTLSTSVGIAQVKSSNEQWKYVRAKVTAAGSGITLDNATIGGHSA